MGMEDIKTVYDSETQALIDFYNNQINEIAEEYNNKIGADLQTATGISYLESHGGIERIREEFKLRLETYGEPLQNIYLTAVPKYIIKKDSDNNATIQS
jgi:translation initiation factor 2 alpha subunit (eIF-2alpha)